MMNTNIHILKNLSIHKISYLLFSCLLVACSSAPVQELSKSSSNHIQSTPYTKADEKLGTRWGDEIQSTVSSVNLKRLSNQPVAEVQVRYADKDFVGREINSISVGAGQISFVITNDMAKKLPMYRVDNNYYLSAKEGQSYQLRYTNHSNRTYEIVASVDGLDVINGKSASRSYNGYVLRPYSTLVIEGFRKNNNTIASFIFSKPKDSYANNNPSGSIYNVGIIGSVVYELNAPKKPQTITTPNPYAPNPQPQAFPADN